ncbi:MAG: tryptophan synthase subunit alpha [Desulfitobacterium sp.]|nr:tryptophan synthase subunit alpha [Desulfitobacterium sp.]
MSLLLEKALKKAQNLTPSNPLGIGITPYLMAGDPNPETTLRRMLQLAKGGVDVIELGVPFSDPMADGPIIQAAGQRALEQGMNLTKVLRLTAQFRAQNQDTPILLMSYLNPLLKYGLESFLRDAQSSGINGLILPELPWRESSSFQEKLKKYAPELTLIPMVAQTSSQDHLKSLSQAEKGFAYVLSRHGITGGDATILDSTLEYIRSLKEELTLPLYVGFGIHSPNQVEKLAGVCQGVIVGSALVQKYAHLDALDLPHEEKLKKEEEIATWLISLRQPTLKEE